MSILQTPRLALRELDFGDGEFILELLNDAGFLRHIGDKGVRSVADARDYILNGPMDSYAKNGFGLYATCLRDGTPIGICGLVRREGLDLSGRGLRVFWNGIGRRAMRSNRPPRCSLTLQECSSWEDIVAITSPDNAKSIAVLEKIGFQFSRMIRLAADTPELNLFVRNRAGSRHEQTGRGAGGGLRTVGIRSQCHEARRQWNSARGRSRLVGHAVDNHQRQQFPCFLDGRKTRFQHGNTVCAGQSFGHFIVHRRTCDPLVRHHVSGTLLHRECSHRQRSSAD